MLTFGQKGIGNHKELVGDGHDRLLHTMAADRAAINDTQIRVFNFDRRMCRLDQGAP